MNELNLFFVQRLNLQYYKDEVKKIKVNDSPIKIKLISGRLRSFKIPEMKEKYNKKLYLELRLVTVELENGTEEKLLTNIPLKIMSTDDIYHIYGDRWIIETNDNKLKKQTRNRKLHIRQPKKHYTRCLLHSNKLQDSNILQ